jgi:hypothetical protein
VADNPKSQKEENETTNEISGSSMVLGDCGRGALVERAGVCFLRDPHFRPGSNDAILDGGTEAMGSIHPRLDLFRLRPGRVNRGGGKHWPVHAKGLDHRMFAIGLVAVIVQMVYTMIIAGGLQVMGPSGAVMPSLIIVIAAALLWFSSFARSRNW